MENDIYDSLINELEYKTDLFIYYLDFEICLLAYWPDFLFVISMLVISWFTCKIKLVMIHQTKF